MILRSAGRLRIFSILATTAAALAGAALLQASPAPHEQPRRESAAISKEELRAAIQELKDDESARASVLARNPSLANRNTAIGSAPPANRVGLPSLPSAHALTNATVHVSPDQVLEHATVIFKNGVITDVFGTPQVVKTDAAPKPGDPSTDKKDEKPENAAPDSGAAAPASPPAPPAPPDPRLTGLDARDATGLHIYAGFLEPYLEVDAPRPDPDTKGAHWSARVMPQRRALDGKGLDESTAKSLRALGYAAAVISPKGGIFRGQSAAVSLAMPEPDLAAPRPQVYRDFVYHSVALEFGGGNQGGPGRWPGYPDSQMGAIAMVRQVLSDASEVPRAEVNSLGVLAQSPPRFYEGFRGRETASTNPKATLFSTDDELDLSRVAKIADEFDRPAVILGSGLEFRRLPAVSSALKANDHHATRPLLVPINFPEKPKIASTADAEDVNLRDLMTWEQAPTNPRRLRAAGIDSALTTARLKDRGRFWPNLREAIRHGLSEHDALAMITTDPARITHLDEELGTIEVGKRASLVVADGPIFAKKSKLREVWVDGQRHELAPAPVKAEGFFAVTLTPNPPHAEEKPEPRHGLSVDKDNAVTIRVWEDPADPKTEKKSTAKSVSITEDRISFVFDHEPFGSPGLVTVSALVERDAAGAISGFSGSGMLPDGKLFTFTAQRDTDPNPPKKDEKKDAKKSDAKADANDGAKADEKGDTKPDGDKPDGGKPAPKPDAKDTKDTPAAPAPSDAVSGTWACSVASPVLPGGSMPLSLNLVLKDGHISGSAHMGDDNDDTVDGTYDAATGAAKVTSGPGELTGTIVNNTLTLSGSVGGAKLDITGSRAAPAPGAAPGKDDDKDEPADAPDELPGLPFGAYAIKTVPKPIENVLIKNATIWTSGPDGIIQNGTLILHNGKIEIVGAALGPSAAPTGEGWLVIDAQGKHVTPGIIDCHSHTGISKGVNEGGQAVTAEVRIADVTNPDAINWYRQLAGGVTAVNNLHGSANAIGGQSQVNKLRWGCAAADDMHMEGAIPGIKFALGENPKGGNGGEGSTYPQTRMGVEMQIRDRFTAAREYAARRAAAGTSGQGPPRDLELEALAEVLAGTRIVHCHSYRQDEILMLARVARDFGFKLGTYQHILEGYKVADIIRDSSGGASGFSDWWAYKVEVQDAIPAGFPIMFEQGVVVSFNSDSDEMARRMNIEAAKGAKYSRAGDGAPSVSPEEALKWVTINPAKQLRIDSMTGSLEAGKQADVVIWSGDPLSAFSKAEYVFVDGALEFSLQHDAELRARDTKERARIIQKILRDGKKPGAKTDGKSDAKPGEGKAKAPTLDAAPAEPRRRRPQVRPPELRPEPTPSFVFGASAGATSASPFAHAANAGLVDESDLPTNLLTAAHTAPDTWLDALRSGAQRGGLLARTTLDAFIRRRELNLDLLRRGLDPANQKAGACGCD
ncbi:hypothetical protein BH11PLA1_BH11PLA1_02760 [soil metagenome]